jgi:serine/threonine protein kinase/formylglycine-generating enzyme required for sulfatase activity
MKTCPQCHKTYDDLFDICPDDDASLVDFTGQFSADPLVGKMFAGRFQIAEKIGQGGMGAIYKAVHTRMDRPCAIKLLTSLSSDNEAARARFNREAKMASRIDHPHAVIIYDFGESETGIAYLAMEFIDGKPLSHLLAREKTLPTDRVVRITNQIAEALSAAHSLGIVHRDLKPDNIMLTRKGDDPDYVKVLDFGIAKTMTDEEIDTLTKTGYVLGTPLYMSPEQLSGDKLDGRSDIYSLAIIVYEMLCGRLPFDGDNTQAMMIKRVTGNPIPLRERAPEVSREIEGVVMNALSRDRERRIANVMDFASALANARWSPASREDKSTNALEHLSQGRATVEYSGNPSHSTVEQEGSPGQATIIYSSYEGAAPDQPPEATIAIESSPTPWEPILPDTDDRRPEITRANTTNSSFKETRQGGAYSEAPTEHAIPRLRDDSQPELVQSPNIVKSEGRRVSPWVWYSSGAAVVGIAILIYFLLPTGGKGFTLVIKDAPPGSEVFIGSVKRGVTDADGTLRITEISEGNAQVRIAREGYAELRASVAGTKGEERSLEAFLLPLEVDFQGEMILIPAGEFIMGDDNGPDDARPAHTVNLKAFYIDKYEVTNAEYKKFCDDTDRKPPANPSWDQNYFLAHPESPVLGVTRDEAIAYAEWAGKRLLTEQEWEKAASWDPVAKKKRLWPWGDSAEQSNVNLSKDHPEENRPESVRHQTRDRSAYGVHGMAGNVWEWVSGYYDAYPGNQKPNPDFGKKKLAMRGGSFIVKNMDDAKTSFRNWLPAVFPARMTTPVGIRGAIDADDPDFQEFLRKNRGLNR